MILDVKIFNYSIMVGITRPNSVLGYCGEFLLSRKLKEYRLIKSYELYSSIYKKVKSRVISDLGIEVRRSVEGTTEPTIFKSEEESKNFKKRMIEEEYKIAKKLFGYANHTQFFETPSLDLLSGFPDFLVKDTKVFIEVKVNSGRLTDMQKKVFSELTKKHHIVFLAKYKISISDSKIEIIESQYEKILGFRRRGKSSLEEIKKTINSNPKSYKDLEV